MGEERYCKHGKKEVPSCWSTHGRTNLSGSEWQNQSLDCYQAKEMWRASILHLRFIQYQHLL